MRGLHKAARGGAFPAACQAAAAPSSAGLEAGRAGGRPARGSSAAPRMEPPVPPPQEPPPRPRSHTVTTTSSSFTANLSASSSTLAYDREFLRTLPGLLMVTEIVSVPREAAAMEERAGGVRGGAGERRPGPGRSAQVFGSLPRRVPAAVWRSGCFPSGHRRLMRLRGVRTGR